jgi:hypothetical protein
MLTLCLVASIMRAKNIAELRDSPTTYTIPTSLEATVRI